MEVFGFFFIVLFVVIAMLVIPYLFLDLEQQVLDEKTRSDLPGTFVKLSGGYTRYTWAGPDTGPIVVLIHGFSASDFVWDYTATALVDAGFRVLRYDLYGRGYSDRPRVVYDENLFDTQLLELLTALHIDNPVDLVGLSMGGAIAVIFAARHPGKTGKLVLVDPAGYPLPVPLFGRVARAPVIGDYLMQVLGNQAMLKEVNTNLHGSEKLEEFTKRFREPMVYRGYKRALLSTLRNFDLSDQTGSYETVGKQGRDVLLFWGDQDRIIPLANSEKIKGAIPGVALHVIEGAGHIANYDRPEIVNPILVRFLKETGQ